MPAQAESDIVLSFFVAVLQENHEILSQINCSEADLTLVEGELIFSLAGLQACIRGLTDLSFSDFKQLIYNSTINQQLSAYGAELSVYESRGKINQNRYRLKRLHKV